MSLPPRRRKGFTLIELLVVIAIISTLIALLVPAVQTVRAAAARTQCVNNLKQWGLGMHSYHDIHQKFPIGSTGYSAANNPGVTARNTWIPYVWPYVEQQPLYQEWNFETGWENLPNTVPGSTASPICAPIFLYYCPSDRATTQNPAFDKNDTNWRLRISYVASLGPYASPPTTADVGNGVFGFQVLGTGPFAFDLDNPFQTRILQITNGTSNTLMMSESIMSLADAAGGDQRGDVFNDDMLAMAWGFSAINPPNSLSADVQPACGGSTPLSPCVVGSNTFISARSWHPGGVNALFSDGHVDFMSNGISQSTWATMSTRDGNGGAGIGGIGLQNGDFATPALSSSTDYSGSGSVPGFSDGFGYIYSANSTFPSLGNTSWTWGGSSVLVNVFSGSAWAYDVNSLPAGVNQAVSLQDSASISQTFFLSAGSHTLSFYLAQRPGYGQNAVSVYMDGSLIYSPPIPPNTWTQYSTTFNVTTSGQHTLLISTSPGNPNDDDTGITGIVAN